jgi:hypothetical protein
MKTELQKLAEKALVLVKAIMAENPYLRVCGNKPEYGYESTSLEHFRRKCFLPAKNLKDGVEKTMPLLKAVIEENHTLEICDEKLCGQFLKDFTTFWTIEEPKFPELPEGEEWHNPDNFSPAKVETQDGWRLITKSEWNRNVKYPEVRKDYEMWGNIRSKWLTGGYLGFDDDSTYRTKEPLPTPQPAEEMTVAQIEAALGKRIKIVK